MRRPGQFPRWLAPVVGLAVAPGCLHDPFEEVSQANTLDAYQRYVLENPDGRAVDRARERIEEIRWDEARTSHTALGYKRFLEDFPTSERAGEARKRLEGLRFAAAQQRNDAGGWADFLRDHPDGAHAAEARDRLEGLEWAVLEAAPTRAALEQFARRWPTGSRRGKALAQADDLAFEQSQRAGPSALAAYVAEFPEGRHREEARVGLAAIEARAAVLRGDAAGFEAVRPRLAAADATTGAAQLAALQFMGLAAPLDVAALTKAQATLAEPWKARGTTLLATLKKEAKRLDPAMRRALEELQPGESQRPVEELVAALGADDPLDRALALEELTAAARVEQLDLLIEAAVDARFELVRGRALAALEALSARTPLSVREVEGRRRLAKLERDANSPRLFAKVALLQLWLGDRTALAATLPRALRGDDFDLLALRLQLELALPNRAQPLALAGAARRLAVAVDEALRSGSGPVGEGAPPLLSARWLFGALEQVRFAQRALEGITPAEGVELGPDLEAFRQTVEAVRRSVAARLGDAEDAARRLPVAFRPSDSGEVRERLAEGLVRRRAALARLTTLPPTLSFWPLALALRTEPDAPQREALRRALPTTPPYPELETWIR